MTRETQERSPEVVTTVKQLLAAVSRLPRLWIIFIIALAILSTLDVTRTTSADVSVRFHVTAVTAVIVALAWLPAIVRAIVLTGGALKTPAGEASTHGVIDLLRDLPPEAKREVLPSLAAALDSVGAVAQSDEERIEARAVRGDIERELQSSLIPTGTADQILDEYAKTYEEIRRELPPSPERTFRMGAVMSEVRAVAGFADLTSDSIRHRFQKGTDGDRVVALTLLEADPMPGALDVVLDGIANSRSAFEQYQALRAAEELLPMPNQEERHKLGEVLSEEYMDPKGEGHSRRSKPQLSVSANTRSN